MTKVTDFKTYRDKKLREKHVPRHFGHPPQASPQKSKKVLMLAAAAMVGVVAYQLHFVILPYVCAIACVVIVARLARPTAHTADKPEQPGGAA